MPHTLPLATYSESFDTLRFEDSARICVPDIAWDPDSSSWNISTLDVLPHARLPRCQFAAVVVSVEELAAEKERLRAQQLEKRLKALQVSQQHGKEKAKRPTLAATSVAMPPRI